VRHLQIADDDVVRILSDAGERFLAITRVINLKTCILERITNGRSERALVFDDEDRRPADRLHRWSWRPGRRSGFCGADRQFHDK
jgi:hypothetical protein